LTHIFNLNIPETSERYLHRVGRTGRQGRTGLAVSIATQREAQFIKLFEKELGIKIISKRLYKGKVIDAQKNRS